MADESPTISYPPPEISFSRIQMNSIDAIVADYPPPGGGSPSPPATPPIQSPQMTRASPSDILSAMSLAFRSNHHFDPYNLFDPNWPNSENALFCIKTDTWVNVSRLELHCSIVRGLGWCPFLNTHQCRD